MPPSSIGKPLDQGPSTPQRYEKPNYVLTIFQSTANLLAHILVGIIVAMSYSYAFRNGLPLHVTKLHIVLCVAGYHLLMAEAILSLTNKNGWSSKLRLVDKRRAHWILQILGSSLAIAGSIIKMLDKVTHFNTLHSKFALVAFVFTTVSLGTGLTSLWAFELRRFIPANLSTITHICFGTVAFLAASVCLCYGYDKKHFRNWAKSPVADSAIAFVVILLVIVIVNPLITFYTKSVAIVQSR